jgi:hypothetical protein
LRAARPLQLNPLALTRKKLTTEVTVDHRAHRPILHEELLINFNVVRLKDGIRVVSGEWFERCSLCVTVSTVVSFDRI